MRNQNILGTFSIKLDTSLWGKNFPRISRGTRTWAQQTQTKMGDDRGRRRGDARRIIGRGAPDIQSGISFRQ